MGWRPSLELYNLDVNSQMGAASGRGRKRARNRDFPGHLTRGKKRGMRANLENRSLYFLREYEKAKSFSFSFSHAHLFPSKRGVAPAAYFVNE